MIIKGRWWVSDVLGKSFTNYALQLRT